MENKRPITLLQLIGLWLLGLLVSWLMIDFGFSSTYEEDMFWYGKIAPIVISGLLFIYTLGWLDKKLNK